MRIGGLITVFLCLFSLFASAKGRKAPAFRSDCLETMASFLDKDAIARLPEGENYKCLAYSGNPVTVIKSSKAVEHIGFSLFTPTQRRMLGAVAANFLERYMLDAELPREREKKVAVQMLEDGVDFVMGSRATLLKLCRDTLASLSLNLIDSKRYVFRWGKEGILAFPAEAELLLGRSQKENDARLPEELKEFTAVPLKAVPGDGDLKSEGDVLVKAGDILYTPVLNSDLYYYKLEGSGKVHPIDSKDYPEQTCANLFGGAVDAGKIILRIKMAVYGLKHKYFEAPLSSVIGYCVNNACSSYWGPVSSDADMIEGMWILKNDQAGYVHVFRVQMSPSVAAGKTGYVTARLTPFVPLHNVKYLFEEIHK